MCIEQLSDCWLHFKIDTMLMLSSSCQCCMLGVKKSEVKLTEKLTAISLQITVYCSSSSCSFIITTSITELKDLSEFSSTSFELYCQQFNYCEWHF